MLTSLKNPKPGLKEVFILFKKINNLILEIYLKLRFSALPRAAIKKTFFS